VHLDAHTDTNMMSNGSKYTHGTVFRRAVEEGLVAPSRSLQIGLRGSTFSDTSLQESRDLGYAQVLGRGFNVERAVAVVHEIVSGPTYVSIDIDVLDPAYGGLSGTPEIGGLSTRELLEVLYGLAEPGIEVVAGDVVEVAPPFDPAGTAALVGSNLVFELVSLIALLDG
jgi:guanidinopropionase